MKIHLQTSAPSCVGGLLIKTKKLSSGKSQHSKATQREEVREVHVDTLSPPVWVKSGEEVPALATLNGCGEMQSSCRVRREACQPLRLNDGAECD